MNLLYWLLFPSLIYVHVEAGGIVKSCMEDGTESINSDFLLKDTKYKQFLECSYVHNFKSTEEIESGWESKELTTSHRHVFFLQCIELENTEEKFVVLYFNSLAVDRLVVKSCDKKEVESSIFPPKLQTIMEEYYEYIHKHAKDQISPHFRFLKEGDDNCYERYYTVGLTTSKEAEKFKLVLRQSPTVLKNRNSKCGDVEFINCRAPMKALQDIVTQYLQPDHGITAKWVPYNNEKGEIGVHGDITGLTIHGMLQCWVLYPGFKMSDVFANLICVKVAESSGEMFYAFVEQVDREEFNMERFTVTSCKEDAVVYAIFPGRHSNPQYNEGSIRFKQNGKCYERNYVKDQQVKTPNEIDCPSNVFEWVNPRIGSSVMWSSCIELKSLEIQKLKRVEAIEKDDKN